MSDTIWILGGGMAGLVLFSTLNLALRTPSRARFAEAFERRGRPEGFERFVMLRTKYLLATAALRSAAVVAVFVGVLTYFRAGAEQSTAGYTLIGCLAAWAVLLILGVAIPQAAAEHVGAWLVAHSLGLLDALYILCFPLVWFLELFDPVVRRLVGASPRDSKTFADELEQEILSAVSEGELHGAVDPQEKEMIESVIELGDMRVAEIMTTRTDVVAVPVEAPFPAVLDAIRLQGHSRIPVFDGTIDTIVGVLYAKDILGIGEGGSFSVREAMRKAFFVPESKHVRDLLRDFQREKVHIALVLDEYGGTAGLVTIEDILEELVGDIADEHEPAEPEPLRKIDPTTFEVDARMRIDELNEELGLSLPDNRDYETIGGFVFSTLGKIPKAGEECGFANVSIRVLAAEPRRVTRLLLTVGPSDEATAPAE